MSQDKTIHAGIVGWPVEHSLSPAIHNYWIGRYGIDGTYSLLAARPEEFANFVAALPAKGFAGANVTIPHKQAAFRLSDTLDEDARAAGAVNLLVFEEGKIHGRNTDVGGFSAALKEAFGPDAAGRGTVAVLGAGGAARAVVLALTKSGAGDIRVVNRTRARAEDLIDAIGRRGGLASFEWGDWDSAFADCGLLVNATSLGMKGKEPLAISLGALPQTAAVADIVYSPLETDLLKQARTEGRKTMDGLGMLVHQAVPAFAAWFGVTPQVTPELRALLEEKLRG